MSQSDIFALAFTLLIVLALGLWFIGWHQSDPEVSRQFWHEVMRLPERKLTEWAERAKRQ